MEARTCLLSSLLLAGCAAAPTMGRVPQVPALATTEAQPQDEVRLRTDADRRPPVATFDEVAAPPSTAVAYRTFTRTVEVPVEVVVEREVPVQTGGGHQGSTYGSGYDYERRRHRAGWFPVHTVVGAGVGAIIGRHHGHSRRGAWIGAHTGLLFDMARWWR